MAALTQVTGAKRPSSTSAVTSPPDPRLARQMPERVRLKLNGPRLDATISRPSSPSKAAR
jgi:hypothetical protein